MAIPVQRLLEAAALPAGYEQPYEMLHACHDRVRRMLDLLGRLQDHVQRAGADGQARQAARDILRYFDLAAPQHHLDEERHVLPLLEAAGDAGLGALARRLREDHRAMEQEWAAARVVLDSLAAAPDGAPLDAAGRAVLSTFAGRYAGHLEAEDAIAFPAARQAAGDDVLRAMADDMMARRGIRESPQGR